MTTRPAVEADLRRALARAGKSDEVIAATLSELSRVFAAVERARGGVDDELVWALLAVQADRARRRARPIARHVRVG